MSNRVVPAIYKQVIEDVISAVREDFEEYGVDDNLVGYLQQLWEASLVQTRVAKFVDGDDDSEDEQPLGAQVRNGQGSALPSTSQLLNLPRGHPYGTEDVKPQIDANGNGAYNGGLRGGASGSTMMRLRGGARSDDDDDEDDEDEEDIKPSVATRPNVQRAAAPGMAIPGMTGIGIPGIGGEDDYAAIAAQYGDEDDEDDEDDNEATSRQPGGGLVPGAVASGSGVQRDASGNIISGGAARLVPNEHGIYPGEEIIDSDLDDSDEDEDDERGGQDEDEDDEEEDLSLNVMYCIYDKVQRNKNKWKVTFRDGMIRANGKEYLFNKCTGEFEW
ncbi:transcription factor IIA subunit alpha [Naganishia albida]|nr:transcription factor IIA subunit alpha [Naganishia albida]